MATYRVGPEGATVLSADGRVILRLRPGHVVVPGIVGSSERPPERADAADVPDAAQRGGPSGGRRPRPSYETKPIRPDEGHNDG
jgi:hypothetical protein